MKKGIIIINIFLMSISVFAQDMYTINEKGLPQLNIAGANHLASLASHCIQTEYPIKL